MNITRRIRTYRRATPTADAVAVFLALVSAGGGAAWAEPAGHIAVVTLDPYAEVDWEVTQRHTANMHTHSTHSDGIFHPHQVVDEYHSRGYTVLALTDHDRVTYPWTNFAALNSAYENRDPAALGMLAIPGNELSLHHHVLSLFSNFRFMSFDLERVLTELGAYSPDARGVICHPAMHWPRMFGLQRGIQVPMTPALRQVAQGEFTLETWFRTTDTGRHVLMGNYSTSHRGALNLELHTANRLRLYVEPVSGSIVDLILSADTLDMNTRNGQWHHLAGVRCGGKVYLYLNGLEVGLANSTAAFDLQGNTFYLGRDTRTGTIKLNGDLDHTRLWTRGLSAEEIGLLASGSGPNHGVSADGLLAQYTFDRPVQAADTGGHAAGPFHAERAEPGYRIPLAPALRQVTQGEFTLEARFRTTDTERNILMGNFSSANWAALNLELHTGNRLRVYIQPRAGQGSTLSFFATPPVNTRDGQWRYLAAVRRGGEVILYLDGEEIERVGNDLAFDLDGEYFHIGRDTRTSLTTAFKGDVDQVRIWLRGLGADEVASLSAGGTPGGPDVPADGLLAAYTLEPSTWARDSGGHPDGPFHG